MKTSIKQSIFSERSLFVFGILFAVFGAFIIWRTSASDYKPAGDINGDKVIDSADLSILLSQFGSLRVQSDINGDTKTDSSDMSIVLSSFGQKLP